MKKSPLKIALIGYGKMGKLIESLAGEYSVEVVARFTAGDTHGPEAITKERLQNAQVAIDFSHPEAAHQNLLRLAVLQVPTICGTTGWYRHLPEVCDAFRNTGTSFIYGANFSIGVNLFDRVLREAAKLFATAETYAAYGWEAHHDQKKDAPSGTLLKLVETMQAAGYSREIHLSSTRAGFIPGTHEIGFDSPSDTITLRHTARNREGFARGALFAATTLLNRPGVFEFSEILFHES